MSEAHLGCYCAKSDLVCNSIAMADGKRAGLILKGGEGQRLTNKLAAKAYTPPRQIGQPRKRH